MKKNLFNYVVKFLDNYYHKYSISFKKQYCNFKVGDIILIDFNNKKNVGFVLRIKGKDYLSYTVKLLIKIKNVFIIKNFFLFDKRIKKIDLKYDNQYRFKACLNFIEKRYIQKISKFNPLKLNVRFKLMINKLDKY